MSFRCQIFQNKRLTLSNVFVKNCDVRLIIIIFCLIATTTILPIIKCAKLENPQIRLLINDDDLLQEKSNIHEAAATALHENSGEHFNLYRSELKRLSYETIHRILRDENEPSYRREDTELRYYQKRSPSYEETHQLIKRDTTKKQDSIFNLSKRNLKVFLITPEIEKDLQTASVLDLSNNFLTSLNITQIDKFSLLTTLNLKNNSFTQIPLSEQSLLKSLNLNHNLVQNSRLPANIYLRNLYLSGNYIENLSAIPLSLLKNLESLDVSFNRLRNTESSYFAERMHNLKHLNLAYNQLGSIYRETFYNLLSLNTLLLSHNNISDIDYETFLALPNLQYLDLSYNRLRGKSIRALQGITGLVALNIAYNPEIGPFMQEFVASWSLKELDASGTGLCQIPAALAQSVRSLKLTHNWLKVINCGDLDSYPLLQYLDLSNSHIEYIEDDAMGRLEILEILMLDHNQLKKIPVSLPVSLEHLFLNNNEIMDIPQQAFQGLNNLKTLDLSHNKLMYLPDLQLPKLVTLNLQSAEIKGINQAIVHTLPKLNDLMLEDNPIKCSDLLGIAEWASTCRLRAAKEDEGEEQDESTDEYPGRILDLKKKFEKMYNFYEKFPMDGHDEIESLLNFQTKPSCLNAQSSYQIITTTFNKDKNAEVDVKENSSLNLLTSSTSAYKEEPLLVAENLQDSTQKTKKEEVENFNQNSVISIPTLASTARETLMEHNKTDANEKNAVKQQQQEDAVKTITWQNYAKTKTEGARAATMQSDILKEKQTLKFTTKTFNNAATTTIYPIPLTTLATTMPATDVKPQQHDDEFEKVFAVKPRFTNEMKTFDHLTATASTEANAAATSTTTSTTTNISAAKDEIASIGNSQTQTFQTMTEVVEVATKRGEDANGKITSKSSKKIQQMALQKNTHKMEKINENRVDLSKKEAKEKSAAALQPELLAINSQAHPEQLYSSSRSKTTKDEELTTVKTPKIILKGQLQLEDIKTKIPSTNEIKSLTTSRRTITIPTIMQRTNEPTTATTSSSIEITTTLKSPSEITANLEKPNKELNEEFSTTSKPNSKNILKPTTNPSHPYNPISATAINKDMTPTSSTTEAAALLKTSTIVEVAVAATTAVKDKDFASNYNDNDNNRQTTTTNMTNNTSNTTTTTYITTIMSTTTMPFENANKTSSSNIKNITNKDYNKMLVPLDIPITSFTNIVHQNANTIVANNLEQQQQQQSLPKDVNVKCMQSNSNECNSSKPQRQEEIGTKPTMETTMGKIKTTTLRTTLAATTTLPVVVIHKHEPLQLLVKDRHLIGTPLLMHKGENLMVTADELILPTNNHHDDNTEAADKDKNKHKRHDDIKTTTATTTTEYAKTNKHSLERSQQHNIQDETKINISPDNKKEHPENQHDKQQHEDNNKLKKSNLELKTKKPSLIMKKMTIITTKQHKDAQHEHHEQQQQQHQQHNGQPKENEVHQRNFDNTHYQELKPIIKKTAPKDMPQNLKHSTVNTPINKEASLLKEPHTFQHEHEMLVQQILQDQLSEIHEKYSKTEQWSDLRKSETKESHQSGLILLVSSGLFLVLLLGLMHVYRCDMPWRRHSTAHHLRPHQRPSSNSLEDDSHSFLSYNEGMQKWHHSTRLEAPYNSPLHNLHVRELQKTSATEKAATVKTSASNFRQPLNRSNILANTRSLSQSSTTSTSTASPSSSAILDDESFYIEMTPDSGQLAHALQSEILPMELLNMAQLTPEYSETTVDHTQTSMEDETDDNCLTPYHHQTPLTHSSHTSLTTPLPSLASLATSSSFNVKPQSNPRKFGLW